MKKFLQRRLINWIVGSLYNTVSVEDVIQFRGHSIWVNGKELKGEVAAKLTEDAERFHDSAIWKVLFREVQFAANERMFREARTVDDIMFGKAILYANKIYSDALTKLAQFTKGREQETPKT